MPDHPDKRRRWLGVLFLALAAGLLFWGQTVFSEHLSGPGYVAYYGICFLFTLLAILTAMLDMWIIRTRIRMQRRDLIQRALGIPPLQTRRTAEQAKTPAG